MRTELLRPGAVPSDVAAFNSAMAERFAGLPSLWEIGVEAARNGGFMPTSPPAPDAFDIVITKDVSLHVVPHPAPKAVLLHIHGGGFMLGGAGFQDAMLARMGANAQMTCVSVEYRLAPEHPYPAAWDDCEAAALWLVDNAFDRLGASKFVIAGESAGALLAVATLLRMRERGLLGRFRGAALSFGVYDSTMSPSQAQAHSGVLKARDIEKIVESYAPEAAQRRAPDLSPLYADLHGLPRALFTVGTLDAMLDDSMFMYCRWLAAGGEAEIALYPGADHGFIETPHPSARAANDRIDRFLAQCVEGL
ncbi:alpha/beta hydrolase fold domain-containing protein [Novosphingobium resinovorum]|uniref:alpha/beta hydrolase fold domain-containing protein n=1 Tax=Novosphingobium resinovorum TaxID=158500 RepID=UPI002ED063EE|nr:alpha/beta hydrolase fold domain-containing protein [Novosphingobium resinovorum]